MVEKRSNGRFVFNVLNYTLLISFAIACILPLVNILAISFSDKASTSAGLVNFWPVGFTTSSYEFVFQRQEFFHAFWIAIERVVIGASINMVMTVLVAYPLSKEQRDFPGRSIYAWIFVVTILFSGGLIPWYITIKQAGLLDSIWALILPGAVPVFNCILLLNFFRGLPKALEEAAFVDGANHWTTLWRIFIPLSMPALATILLFSMVSHWNSWFDGLILMNSPDNYPLQSYLQTLVVLMDASTFANIDPSQAELLAKVSDRTVKSAQIFMAAVPILLVYPFLQRYFMTGIVMGSVKE
jgi:putative aldouronate transport system permease protein